MGDVGGFVGVWTRGLSGARDELAEFSSKCSMVSEINGCPCIYASLLKFAGPDASPSKSALMTPVADGV